LVCFGRIEGRGIQALVRGGLISLKRSSAAA
jgi:hypothetical protein